MAAWQTILIAFSGNAGLLAVLGFLGKSIVEKILARDSQRFEIEIRHKASIEIEKLRSSLTTAANEHQIRFSHLHERRARVIADTYARLRELHMSLADYVKFFEPAGDKSKEERRKIVGEAHRVFIDFYQKNKIFLSKTAVKQLDAINEKSISAFYDFFYEVEMVEAKSGHEIQRWSKIFEQVKDEMPIALDELETEFRRLLGDEG